MFEHILSFALSVGMWFFALFLLTQLFQFSCAEFLRRPPINKTSELVEKIIKSNETKRVKSYVEAGCINSHDGTQNISKCKCSCQSIILNS